MFLEKLIARVKDKGLSQAEEAVKTVIGETLDLAQEELAASDKSILVFVAGLIPLVKAQALKAADKIDGEVG